MRSYFGLDAFGLEARLKEMKSITATGLHVYANQFAEAAKKVRTGGLTGKMADLLEDDDSEEVFHDYVTAAVEANKDALGQPLAEAAQNGIGLKKRADRVNDLRLWTAIAGHLPDDYEPQEEEEELAEAA